MPATHTLMRPITPAQHITITPLVPASYMLHQALTLVRQVSSVPRLHMIMVYQQAPALHASKQGITQVPHLLLEYRAAASSYQGALAQTRGEKS